jgi:hypothetical protein
MDDADAAGPDALDDIEMPEMSSLIWRALRNERAFVLDRD